MIGRQGFAATSHGQLIGTIAAVIELGESAHDKIRAAGYEPRRYIVDVSHKSVRYVIVHQEGYAMVEEWGFYPVSGEPAPAPRVVRGRLYGHTLRRPVLVIVAGGCVYGNEHELESIGRRAGMLGGCDGNNIKRQKLKNNKTFF
jgi:hypothetical protein